MSGCESDAIVEVEDIVSPRANTSEIEATASWGEEEVMPLLLYTEDGCEMAVFGFGGGMRVSERGVEVGLSEYDEVDAMEGGGETGIAKRDGERGDLAI